jgi:hypothetical protein
VSASCSRNPSAELEILFSNKVATRKFKHVVIHGEPTVTCPSTKKLTLTDEAVEDLDAKVAQPAATDYDTKAVNQGATVVHLEG